MISSRPLVTILFFISLISLGLGTPWPAFGKSVISINVLRQSEVNKNEICLEDISRITGGDAELVSRLGGIVIGRSPLPGMSRKIDAPHIELRLKQFEIDLSRVRLNVPNKAEVVRGYTQVSKERVQEVALAYIRQATRFVNDNIRVKEIQFRKDVILPKGVTTFKVEPPRDRNLAGKLPLAINIY
jgi:hypothetical protein